MAANKYMSDDQLEIDIPGISSKHQLSAALQCLFVSCDICLQARNVYFNPLAGTGVIWLHFAMQV